MSTQINVTVGGGGLVARAQQQQQGGRWVQGEREEQRRIATEVVDAAIAAGTAIANTAAARRALITNAERQLRLGNTTRLVPGLGALRSTTSAPPASLQPRTRIFFDEPAANRRPESAFLVIININAARDDVFDIYLKTPISSPLVKQPGSADFSTDAEITAYLWTTSGMTAGFFANTKAGKLISSYGKKLALAWKTSQPGIVWRGANRLTGVSPVKYQRFYMEMVVTEANFNGNFGEILTGFVNEESYGVTNYSEGDLNIGQKIVIDDEFFNFWGGTTPQPT